VAGEDPVRAVRAELGAPAAGEQGEPAARRAARVGHAEAAPRARDEVPAGERQRVEVLDLRAWDCPREALAREQSSEGGFGLALHQEIGMRREEVRQLRRGQADKADARS